jgi:hypothetical protein
MKSSRRRMTLTERRIPMSDPIPLATLIDEYLDHHVAFGRSHRTIAHYADSFRLLGIFLSDRRLGDTSHSLTTANRPSFSNWFQETPLQFERKGTTRRSVAGIHGVLRDMRAFTRWLEREAMIEHSVQVPLPRLPQ